MARTDKDRPSWVRADDPLERREESHHHRSWRGEPLVCDIDVPAKDKRSRYSNCGYWLPYTVYAGGPPRWYRRACWHGPERRRERDQFSEAVKLFRGGELEDFDFAGLQHRHGALWDWF